MIKRTHNWIIDGMYLIRLHDLFEVANETNKLVNWSEVTFISSCSALGLSDGLFCLLVILFSVLNHIMIWVNLISWDIFHIAFQYCKSNHTFDIVIVYFSVNVPYHTIKISFLSSNFRFKITKTSEADKSDTSFRFSPTSHTQFNTNVHFSLFSRPPSLIELIREIIL